MSPAEFAAPPASGTALNRWVLRPLRRPDAALRLICVPYAGGGTAAYHGWAEMLPSCVELWILRMPGREARLRERLRTDVAELARDAAAVFASELAEPFALFGHSLGAFVAFELACELRRTWRLTAAHLTVSARSAPHLIACPGVLHKLPDEEFLDALDRRFQAIPPQIREDPAMISLYLPILRADTTMLETYRYRTAPPLTCPITAAGGREDTDCDEAGLRAWREHTMGGFELRMYPGGHFYLQPERERLVRDVSEDLLTLLTP